MGNRRPSRIKNKSEGQHPEHPTEGLTTAIGGLINSPRQIPCVERTGSDDPLVNSQLQSKQLSERASSGL
jgi:hypothetical protein